MLYYMIVKHEKNFLSWILVAVTLPLLGTLALNQFNWLQELQKREQIRIESNMLSSARALSKSLQEELFFLPSLLRIRQEDRSEIEAILGERFRFWQYYSLYPEMVKQLVLVDERTGTYLEWRVDGFAQADNGPAIRAMLEADNFVKFADSRIADTASEIVLNISIYGTKENRNKVLCVLDKTIVYGKLIPALAEKHLKAADLYAYRILDTAAGRVLYGADGTLPADAFNPPDLELPVFEQIRLPSFQQPPDFDMNRLPENAYKSFPFIRDRTQNPSDAPEKEAADSRLLDCLVLQIVNRDASLSSLAGKATAQNALISFGTVILLALVMVALAEATRRSRALALSQKEFIATITHELKTPLAVICSAAQNLSDGLIRDQKKAEQYGSMIRKEAARLGTTIEHFLLYSNTNSISRTKPVLCDAAELVDSALRFTEEERLKREFRTEVVLPQENVFISGDRVALESVFQNLFQNVIRHADAGKYLGIIVSLEVRTKRDPRATVVFRIRDKGPGISAREQKTIFEPFVRGKRAVEGQIPGNGIGLNLARRIVTMHEGTIAVESRPGQGSTFIVTLKGIIPDANGLARFQGA